MKLTASLLLLIGLTLWAIIWSVNARLSAQNLTELTSFEMNESTPLRISGLQVAIEPQHTYVWSSVVTISGSKGEFGFYIDEYDVNGEWISGQWKGNTRGTIHSVFTYEYRPSNDRVRFASPQYYLVKGSSLHVKVSQSSFSER